MCFSPAASFIAAGLTGAVGVLTLTQVRHPRELPLAATPMLFAIQQAIEGLLWLRLPVAPTSEGPAGLIFAFLLFAHVIWPTYSPTAALLMEQDRRRRRLMSPLLGAGLAVSGYLLWALLTHPYDAHILGGHIVYGSEPPLLNSLGAIYVVAVSLPLMLSSVRAVAALGLIVLVGSAVAYAFYWHAFQSVWCFFAAAGSLVILSHFVSARRRRLSVAAG